MDRVFLQAMLSRPVVIGSITGLILGDPCTGVISGALIELLWINKLPLGDYVPPNDSIVAVLAAAGSILAGRKLGCLPKELMTFSILLFIPFGILGQQMDILIMRSNNRLSQRAVESAKTGDIKGVSCNHILGLSKTFFYIVSFIFVFLVSGTMVLVYFFPLIPQRWITTLTYTYFFLPLLGVAVTLNTTDRRGAIPVFCSVFLMGTVIFGLFN